jgi:cysteine desulfurase
VSRPIYLDYNATTPIAPEVLEEILPYLRREFGNPSSAHPYGAAAKAGVETARARLARFLNSDVDEILFTSGGTESDNAAIFGVCRAAPPARRHVVTTAVEHPAVEAPLRALEQEGWRITRIPVGPDGRVDATAVVSAMTEETALVTIMHAQNETGALMPIAAIAAGARRLGIPMHTDAAQSAAKIVVDVAALGVDLLTIAGHKLYAPKGVGALYIRGGTKLTPLLLGAGHESGRRAGTENVAGVVGLGSAADLARRELPVRVKHLRGVRDRLHARLLHHLSDLRLNGPDEERLPNTLNVAIPGVSAAALLAAVPGVAAAAGAACHAGTIEPSAVLLAMGIPREIALCSLRLTVGHPTTPMEADLAAERIASAALELRGHNT